MSPPLRNNPYTLTKNITRLRQAGRIRHLPAWYHPLTLHPPTQFTPTRIIPTETGAFQDSSPIEPRDPYKRQDPKTYRPHYVTKPPQIVYPEDEIRKAFYRWHPLELYRPRTLVVGEEDLKQERDWSTIYGGRPKTVVSGESVVQHTLYLMTHQRLTRHQAYHRALKAFYKARAAQEEEEHAARLAAEQAALAESTSKEIMDMEKDLDLVDSESTERIVSSKEKEDAEWFAKRPLTKTFMEWEEAELAESRKYEQEVADA